MSKKNLKPTPLVIDLSKEVVEEKIELPESEDDIRERWWEAISPRSLLIASIACLGFYGGFRVMSTAKEWPIPSELDPSVKSPPQFTESSMTPYGLSTPDHRWEMRPLGGWDAKVLVTSANPPSKWTEVGVPGRTDLVASDITVLWGQNATEGLYVGLEFGNTATTGFVMNPPEDWSPREFAYLVLIQSTSQARDSILSLRKGDQCRIVGRRVECYLEEDGKPGPSLVGAPDGAYPPMIIDVEWVDFLSREGQIWIDLSKLTGWLAAILFGFAAATQMLPRENSP